mmetsp:Transcript_2033/g.5149  ORF Transcript_2033/g.5149 Transcript_2033/m.5149 type:complete len:331 (-) Transcript_2033:71-1063(-)
MAHGGTNFGFWSGANSQGEANYAPDLTSYDYNAPISEAGDHNIGKDGGDIFAAVAAALGGEAGDHLPEPEPIEKMAYGAITLSQSSTLLENLDILASCTRNLSNLERLPSMESLGQQFGLVLYRSSGAFTPFAINFTYTNLHDRVQVLADGDEVGTAYRAQCPTTVEVPPAENIDLLVENMGRINYGTGLYDSKGLHLNPPSQAAWTAYCLDLNISSIQRLPWHHLQVVRGGPLFLRAHLKIDGAPKDTFLDTRGLTKGFAWVNGHNLGRFWETVGPQHTLYVPAPFLREGDNEVILLDLHGPSVNEVHFVDRPRYTASNDYVSTSYVVV